MRKVLFIMLGASLLLAGCANRGGSAPETSLEEFQEQMVADERVSEINEQLLMMAVTNGGDQVYRVGPEDRIRVDIMGVDDLSREYRVNGAGRILMPLVGEVAVSGMTLNEVEQAIAEAYGEQYLRNPQVSAEVSEYRSQQFTVVGAVESPRVYSVSRQTTLIEALAMAGGLNREAGNSIYLTDQVRDPETGQFGTRTLIIDVEDLMREAGDYNLVLGQSAMINVPRGGYVYVEGAVNSPGAYRQRTDTTVLKALAEAGGLSFEASRANIYVLTRDRNTGEWQQHEVNYSAIRENPARDLPLRNGDIVVVETSGVRAAWTGFWRIASPIALLGFRPL
jgi:polysaccharide biosynthesis/export protein